jgi:hypothetical protein
MMRANREGALLLNTLVTALMSLCKQQTAFLRFFFGFEVCLAVDNASNLKTLLFCCSSFGSSYDLIRKQFE